jgi:RimJ/RimL family protein N-acetyltransferase
VSGEWVSPLAIVLRTPRLVFGLAGAEEARELLAVAKRGVHPADQMPFAVPWTDMVGTAEGDRSFLEYYREAATCVAPERWSLLFCVRHEGREIGVQELAAQRFSDTRSVHTGSWLGQADQGLGYGTEMRAAVLQLAFEALGASLATSGAIEGNAASLGVSLKLGYEVVGMSTCAPRGVEVSHTDLAISRAVWERSARVPVTVEGVDGPARGLLGAPG